MSRKIFFINKADKCLQSAKGNPIKTPTLFPVELDEPIAINKEINVFRIQKITEEKNKRIRELEEKNTLLERNKYTINNKKLEKAKYKDAIIYYDKLVEAKKDGMTNNYVPSTYNLISEDTKITHFAKTAKAKPKLPPLLLVENKNKKNENEKKILPMYDSIDLQPEVVYIEGNRKKKPKKPNISPNKESNDKINKIRETLTLNANSEWIRPTTSMNVNTLGKFDVSDLKVAPISITEDINFSAIPIFRPQTNSILKQDTRNSTIDQFNINTVQGSNWGFNTITEAAKTYRKISRTKSRDYHIRNMISTPRERRRNGSNMTNERLPPPSIGKSIGHGILA